MSFKQAPPTREPSTYATTRVNAAQPSELRDTARDLVAELPLHEWVLLGYLACLFLLAATSTALHHDAAMVRTATNLGVGLLAVGLVRSRVLGQPVLEAFISRSVIVVCLGLSFVQLTELFALRGSANLDESLLRFDLSVFGFEPAVYADRWVTPSAVEWFSFFYFGYYFLLAVHIFPIGYFGRDTQMVHEFALGIVMTFCAGHLLYFAVPGLGPFSLPVFAHRLQGGYWWSLVSTTVQSAGARKDIFPSLHTAVPTFIALFSFRRRHSAPFRYTFVPVALFTSQIILATMFLRWHYVIDVVAGLTLATASSIVAARVSRWESARRAGSGLSAAMPAFSMHASGRSST